MNEDDETWGKTIQSQEYWDTRYVNEKNTTFEWYCDYEQIGPLLEGILPKSSTILEIGCGNSELTLGLHHAGYTVIGTDYAAKQIEHLKQTHPQGPEFQHVDCRQLISKYGAMTFNAVVDKACLDAMLSGGDEGKATAIETCVQVGQVLKENGYFIVVSHAHPETELGNILLSEIVLANVNVMEYRWDVDIHSTGGEMEEGEEEEEGEGEEEDGIHVYVFHKVKRASTRSRKRKRESQQNLSLLDGNKEEFRIQRHFH